MDEYACKSYECINKKWKKRPLHSHHIFIPSSSYSAIFWVWMEPVFLLRSLTFLVVLFWTFVCTYLTTEIILYGPHLVHALSIHLSHIFFAIFYVLFFRYNIFFYSVFIFLLFCRCRFFVCIFVHVYASFCCWCSVARARVYVFCVEGVGLPVTVGTTRTHTHMHTTVMSLLFITETNRYTLLFSIRVRHSVCECRWRYYWSEKSHLNYSALLACHRHLPFTGHCEHAECRVLWMLKYVRE